MCGVTSKNYNFIINALLGKDVIIYWKTLNENIVYLLKEFYSSLISFSSQHPTPLILRNVLLNELKSFRRIKVAYYTKFRSF